MGPDVQRQRPEPITGDPGGVPESLLERLFVNRRRFFECVAQLAGLGAASIGILWYRHSQAIASLQADLTNSADVAVRQSATDTDALIADTDRELRAFFVGACLDAHQFVAEIQSARFQDAWRSCLTTAEQEALLVSAFDRDVVSASAVMERLEGIAGRFAHQLDQEWTACCERVSIAWNRSLPSEFRMAPQTVQQAAEPHVRDLLRRAATAVPLNNGPTLAETGLGIGRTAVLLLPVLRTMPLLGWPAFALTGLALLAEWFRNWLEQPSADNMQWAVTTQLSQAAIAIADQFRRDLETGVADFRAMQTAAFQVCAQQQAHVAASWW